ncbi:MAG: Serine/threonine dehydratase [Gemmatimonadetes bacterium]|nr:Serine/threonine dehydratase [Gemmatimonadota bacterium]
MSSWPITFEQVVAARERISPWLSATPLRSYALLDQHVGHGISLLAKHENFQPTGSFKVRNGLALVTALDEAARSRGVVAASTGNHGLGISFAAQQLGARATICVPAGNNPEKNDAMRALGAEVLEQGRDYDEAVDNMLRVAEERGATIAHSTNDPMVLAGAGTMTLEILEQAPKVDAIVIAVGGGSQAVGAITVARKLAPNVEVHGVQAAGAPAQFDSFHARARRTTERAVTFAEGVATRQTYDLTHEALRDGLAGFVTVSEAETAEAVRTILRSTHTLVEGAGAMGLAAMAKLAPQLEGRTVAIIFCGANMDTAVLRRILDGQL